MILAAGRGTRMGALTEHTPKPLIKLAGMPLIEYHVRALASAGFADIVINVAWLGERIVQTLGNGDRFGVSIEYSYEPEGALETAGGIARALPLLGDAPFLVVNGDVWTDFPFYTLKNVIGSHQSARLAYLIMVPNPDHHPEGDFTFVPSTDYRFGHLAGDRHAGTSGDKFTFSGMGVYAPELFKTVSGRASLGPRLREWIDDGRVGAEYFPGRWWDVGTPERLQRVDGFLRGIAL